MSKRVEICGSIASGKTTLARALGGSFNVISERFRDTQFYHAFYEDPTKYAFETELDFLLQHYHLIKRYRPGRHAICDYSLWLDRAYASANLSPGQRHAFAVVWEEILADLGPPGLIVYLRCPEHVLMQRIARRARVEETAITEEYLSRLGREAASEMRLLSATLPILEINSDNVDFTPESTTRPFLLSYLCSLVDALLKNGLPGRHFLSPPT